MSKVLIVHPDLRRLGGIESYFIKLCAHLRFPYESFSIAKRPNEKTALQRLARILADYFRYWRVLSRHGVTIVHLNPSLERKSFFREAAFLFLAKLHRKKVLVFFHGWDSHFQKELDKNNGKLFRWCYGRADAYIVLASAFTDKLRHWGATQPIHQEVTIIDDKLAKFDLQGAIDRRLEAPLFQLFFPSRLMRAKGVLTVIKALKIIQQTHPNFSLVIAGDGEHAEEARAAVDQLGVNNVTFLGVVIGDKIVEHYLASHVLFFPTEHGEGLPNTIVEAMTFGLPVVTRPVGGIVDFFESGVHGYLSESTDPQVFAELIIRIAQDPERYREIAYANHHYALRHFLASSAAARIEHIYSSI